MLKIGDVLDGKYEIIKQIGKGGTSLVYLAMNQKLNQQWVIKEIRVELDDSAKRRMLKEAHMMMKFDHPAIPRIVDILDDKYIIMDYVSGQSLAHELKTKGPMPEDVVIEWGKQICNVLTYLHSLNPPIIYHDLKPGNIILKMPEKNLKLIDFGEAREWRNGNAPGGGKTKEYAAPEQQNESRGNTDARTDIYCFGTTLYRLLTGNFPPAYPEPVGSVRERFPELKISKGLDNIIRKCTRQNKEKRFQTAQELMEALDNIAIWDEDYMRRQRRKINLCVGSMAAAVILVFASIGLQQGERYVNSQTYESLVSTDAAVGYDMQLANYIEATTLDGRDPRAYMRMVELYQDAGTFGDAEGQQLGNIYNANKIYFDMQDPDVVELNYQIGHLYFNMYSGDGNSFRARIQKAEGYFDAVVENGSPLDEHYTIASSYHILCDFFIRFVLNDNSVLEPVKDDYTSLIDAIRVCVEDMQTYQSSDASYTRLTLYQKIMDAIHANVRGFAANGIEQQQAVQLLQDICDAVEEESVTQSISVELQNRILRESKQIKDNLIREYDNLG